MSEKLTRMRLGEGLDQSLTDWARIDALTDEEIAEAIRNDPDTFEPEPEWFEHALVLRASRPKQRLTVRFDADLVEWFKAQGAGYQTRMNAVLRAYYEHMRKRRADATTLPFRPPDSTRLAAMPFLDRRLPWSLDSVRREAISSRATEGRVWIRTNATSSTICSPGSARPNAARDRAMPRPSG